MPTLSVNTKSGLYKHIKRVVESYGGNARLVYDNHPHHITGACRSNKPHHVDVHLKRIYP